jgi:hypothetical protein
MGLQGQLNALGRMKGAGWNALRVRVADYPIVREIELAASHDAAVDARLPASEHLPNEWSVPVSTSALAQAVRDRPVDCPPPFTLTSLAKRARDMPSFLTQVGVTSTSLRGTERLARLLKGGPPTIGACATTDGLEVITDTKRDGYLQATSVMESGAGRTAIHIDNLQATVSTRLPIEVVMKAMAQAGAHATLDDTSSRCFLEDRHALAALANYELFGEPVGIRLSPFRGVLKGVVHVTPGHTPAVWWVLRDGPERLQCKAEFAVRAAHVLLPDGEVDVDARLMRFGDGEIAMAPLMADREMVRIQRDIQPEKIGIVRTRGGHWVALLNSSGAPLMNASLVVSTPIQLVGLPDLEAAMPGLTPEILSKIRYLPIAVVVD